MSKFKQILTGLLGTAYGMSTDEIAELLDKSDEEQIDEKEVLSTLKEKDKTRISGLKKTSFDDGYKKAESKEKSTLEKKLKEKFSVESDKVGDELIDEVFEAAQKTPGNEGGEPAKITDDAVKKHPVFLSMESNLQKQLKEQKTTFEKQLTDKEAEYSQKQVFDSISKKAIALFESWNPILSADANKAANQRTFLIEKLKGIDYEMVEDQIILNKDGKLLEDGHGNKITFEKYVRDTAEQFFDFKTATERSAPASGEKEKQQQQQQQQQKYTGKLPTTEAEYLSLYGAAKNLVEKRAIQDHWDQVSASA
jgi:hypothetical protein